MVMYIGKMDRQVEIQYRANTQDSTGEDVPTWKTLARVWAQATPMNAKERFASEMERESKVYTFRIRYIKGVQADMRLVHESQNYRITGIAEIGRREGLELTAEYFQSHGGGI